MDDRFTHVPGTSRRRFLQIGGMAVFGVTVAAACTDDGTESGETTAPPEVETTPTTSATTAAPTLSTEAAEGATPDPTTVTTTLVPLTAGMFEGVGVCVLSPDSTAGPFPLEEQFDRYDITEASPGHPLRIGVRVLDASCAPIPDVRVELWHADATGDYSAFTDGGDGKDDGEGTTFLRGSQAVNGDGIAELHSIAPGWYPGRTVHIHVRVHAAGGVVYTGQLYFDPAWVDAVYANAPYAEFGPPDTSNESDRIAGNMTSTSTADTIAGPGSLALVSLSLA